MVRVKDLYRKAIGKKAPALAGSIASREDNLSLYRRARMDNYGDCPNLPLHLLVEVTSRCNLTCRMCNVHHETGSGIDIDEGLLQSTYELARTAKLVSPFGLGEPLLHPGVAGMVGTYKTLGPTVELFTNGMLLKEELSRGLILSGLDQLVISVDAADPALLAEMRGGADLRRIAGNVARLNQLKKSLDSERPLLALSVVVQASNFSQLSPLIELAQEWEVSFIAFQPITVHEHIPQLQREALDSGIASWRETLDACRREAEARGIGTDMQRLYYVLSEGPPEEIYGESAPCPEPFRFLGIRAKGDLFPCCNWDVNDPIATLSGISRPSVRDLERAWQSSKWRDLRAMVASGTYPEQCRKCMANFTRPLHDELLGMV